MEVSSCRGGWGVQQRRFCQALVDSTSFMGVFCTYRSRSQCCHSLRSRIPRERLSLSARWSYLRRIPTRNIAFAHASI